MAIADEVRIDQDWGPDGYKCDKVEEPGFTDFTFEGTVIWDNHLHDVPMIPVTEIDMSPHSPREAMKKRWLKNYPSGQSSNNAPNLGWPNFQITEEQLAYLEQLYAAHTQTWREIVQADDEQYYKGVICG